MLLTENYKNAFTLMRIPFSVFLMPVYWLAISSLELNQGKIFTALSIFVILHLFLYPASNGYNSYFDRDEQSIGGVKSPPKVTKELFHLVVLFDLLAVIGSLFISYQFTAMVIVYMLVSKSYSYDKIRLKKFPILSTVVVTIFQGAFIYFVVTFGITQNYTFSQKLMDNLLPAVSTLFLVGSYPLTQIYQHQEDSKRGDKTLSIMLGIKGTFIFSGIALAFASGIFICYCLLKSDLIALVLYLLSSAIVLVFFNRWMLQTWKNESSANFENTMQMNKISSICMSATFILITVIKFF